MPSARTRPSLSPHCTQLAIRTGLALATAITAPSHHLRLPRAASRLVCYLIFATTSSAACASASAAWRTSPCPAAAAAGVSFHSSSSATASMTSYLICSIAESMKMAPWSRAQCSMNRPISCAAQDEAQAVARRCG